MPASQQTREPVAARRMRVLALRASGASFAQIARTVPGLKNAKSAATDLRRALESQSELLDLSGPSAATWKASGSTAGSGILRLCWRG
jgi:hypothetical protein